MQKPPAIFIMGPTASGKTGTAMKLYDALPCEIISVDSALVYRGMDIGSAKPSAEELKQYPHHLVDIRDPGEPYSAADFREDALRLMAEITARDKIPLLVGGTMMYFKLLIDGMSDLPDANPAIRAAIEADAEKHGWEHVHKQLAEVDPESAQRIHPNDPQRLQRALEVYRVSGETMTQHRLREQQQREEFPYQAVQIAIAPDDRAILHERIAKRFHAMLEQGFEAEVRALYERGDLHPDLPAIRSVGYRQMWAYFDGDYDYETMIHKGIVATRQLAKRQFTWLRTWQDLNWIYTDKRDECVAGDELLAGLSQKALTIVKNAIKREV